MVTQNRHCEEHLRNLPARLNRKKRHGNLSSSLWIASLTLAMTLLTFPTYAKDKKEKVTSEQKNLIDILEESALPEGAVKYAPEGCDFEITFPSAPYKTKRCADNSNKNCTDFTSYTMVYDVTATVEINATCVPSTPEQYKSYTEKVIGLALKGMVERSDISEHQINTREDNDIRQGSLLGSAKRGKQNSIYNAQLWVGQNSVMTVESRLIGPFHAEADTTFSEILNSIQKRKN